jgi:hypothetical protein
MKNMLFANLVMHNVPRPVFMTFNRWRMGVDTPQETPPMNAMRDIQFSNIRVDNSELAGVDCGIVLTGVPGHYIENIAFDAVSITLPGGGTGGRAAIGDLPVFVDRRPEFGVFGEDIPLAGVFARQVRGLSLKNIRIDAAGQEQRPAIVCDDVRELSAADVRISETYSGAAAIQLHDVQRATISDCRVGGSAARVLVEGPKSRDIDVREHGRR